MRVGCDKILANFASMKKLLILIVFSLMVSSARADDAVVFRVLPQRITQQFGELYVCQQGRVCRLRNLCEERHPDDELKWMFYDGQNLKLFPYAVDDSVMWFSQTDPLPVKMTDDEMAFVTKVQIYMQELAEQKDYDELSKVITQVQAYQLKNGGTSLPSAFADALTDFYDGPWNHLIFWIIGYLCLMLMFDFYRKKYHDENYRMPQSKLRKRCLIYALMAFSYVTLLIVIRWILGRHVPLASGCDVMLFMIWCILLVGLIGRKRHSSILPTSILASIIVVFGLCTTDGTITALPTALDSPWLGFHVAVSIASYSFFIMMAINGLRGLILFRKDKDNLPAVNDLRTISYNFLIPGTLCLSAGIIMGGLWAKSAWGAFWSWDPKETWALLTLIVYGLGYLPWFKSAKAFHIFSVVAFIFVLFTYFGVNYWLGGLHGYV